MLTCDNGRPNPVSHTLPLLFQAFLFALKSPFIPVLSAALLTASSSLKDKRQGLLLFLVGFNCSVLYRTKVFLSRTMIKKFMDMTKKYSC